MSDALINGLAGAGGGIIAQLITYPLQTVRILFQKFFLFDFSLKNFQLGLRLRYLRFNFSDVIYR